MGEATSLLIEAMKLEDFINNFKPKHWKESLEQVVYVPPVTQEDLLLITRKDMIPAKFNKVYFIEAINKWKEQNNGR